MGRSKLVLVLVDSESEFKQHLIVDGRSNKLCPAIVELSNELGFHPEFVRRMALEWKLSPLEALAVLETEPVPV